MRLTIFWRVILAQVSLIALILAVSLYTFSQLNRLTSLSTDALATDSTCIEEERPLSRTVCRPEAELPQHRPEAPRRDAVRKAGRALIAWTRDWGRQVAKAVSLADAGRQDSAVLLAGLSNYLIGNEPSRIKTERFGPTGASSWTH